MGKKKNTTTTNTTTDTASTTATVVAKHPLDHLFKLDLDSIIGEKPYSATIPGQEILVTTGFKLPTDREPTTDELAKHKENPYKETTVVIPHLTNTTMAQQIEVLASLYKSETDEIAREHKVLITGEMIAGHFLATQIKTKLRNDTASKLRATVSTATIIKNEAKSAALDDSEAAKVVAFMASLVAARPKSDTDTGTSGQ